MNRDLEWSYRTPPIEPWYWPVLDALTPVVEFLVLCVGVVSAYALACLVVVL